MLPCCANVHAPLHFTRRCKRRYFLACFGGGGGMLLSPLRLIPSIASTCGTGKGAQSSVGNSGSGAAAATAAGQKCNR